MEETDRLTLEEWHDEGEELSPNSTGEHEHELTRVPLERMDRATKAQVASLEKSAPFMKAYGKPVVAEFGPGPLGLQLANVGRRVLVTAIEDVDARGQPSQAKRCGVIQIGYQVNKVGTRSVQGLPMLSVLSCIKQAQRPLQIEFQPLIIPKFPSKQTKTVYNLLGNHSLLVANGAPYEVEFPQRFLGLNVGNACGMVVVSQFLPGGDFQLLRDIKLGDQITMVKTRSSDSQEWTNVNVENLDYADLAIVVREADRPIRIVFRPQKIQPKPEQASRPLSTKRRLVCAKCKTIGPATAKFCWACGNSFAPSLLQE